EKKFLEMLGATFTNMAKGLETQEQIAHHLKTGGEAFKGQLEVVEKFFSAFTSSLKPSKDEARDDDRGEGSKSKATTEDHSGGTKAEESGEPLWERAAGELQKNLTDTFSYLGVAPLREHLELMRKYEELKEKVAAQAETIANLKRMLKEEAAKNIDSLNTLQTIMEKCGEKNVEMYQQIKRLFGLPL
ncbi:MAG: hypothetical protein HQK58_17860, partial [Deltaproteobacteria bacterium]|nr:hypothetical protein [Deltaproteobacteria bacterium]